jgi:hypothetical protein
MRRQFGFCFAMTLCGGIGMTAAANDGGLTFGGTPKMLQSHPTVAMRSETVRLSVGKEEVRVDCRFTFENKGAARRVRMGFPDHGVGEDAFEEEVTAVKARLRRFRSYVNGKPAVTTLIRGKDPNVLWHTKTVLFPVNGQREVRDTYVTPVGSQISEVNTLVHRASYVLHTGSSWRGAIGKSVIEVTFDRASVPGPLRPMRLGAGSKETLYGRDWSSQSGCIYYQGPCKPEVRGRTLRFVRTNWRPTSKDDIALYFDCQRGRPTP